MNDYLVMQFRKEVLEKLGWSSSVGIDALIWIVLISSEGLISWRLNQFSFLNIREGLSEGKNISLPFSRKGANCHLQGKVSTPMKPCRCMLEARSSSAGIGASYVYL